MYNNTCGVLSKYIYYSKTGDCCVSKLSKSKINISWTLYTSSYGRVRIFP